MAKNPFKKNSIVDTAVNVGIGGAANVAFDSIVATFNKQSDGTQLFDATTMNIIKVVAGAVAGSMVSNKYVRAATDGIATVGVSNLIEPYIKPASGLPQGTIAGGVGRVRVGNRAFLNRGRGVRGVNTVDVMDK